MATFFNKMQYLSRKMRMNQINSWKQQPFHSNSCLFDRATFTEKPAWLRKFKLKQAALQKDDNRPTFLKKGLPDKIVYNITLFGLFGCLIYSFKVLQDLEAPRKD